KQERPSRLPGLVGAALEQGDALDDGPPRLVLTDDAAREVVADRSQVHALLVVEYRDGQPGQLGQRDDDLVRADLFGAGLEGAIDGELDEIEHRAREVGGAQVLARGAERHRNAVGIHLQVRLFTQAADPRLWQLGRALV